MVSMMTMIIVIMAVMMILKLAMIIMFVIVKHATFNLMIATKRRCKKYFSYLKEMGRHNYVTPTSYLELIASFKKLLNEQRDTVEKAKKRYTGGLDKLKFAAAQVYFLVLRAVTEDSLKDRASI